MSASKPRMPAGLGAAGRRVWREITGTWDLDGREAQLLVEACRCLDAAAELDAAVARDGVTVSGASGQLRQHPALSEARQQRLAAAKLLGLLDLPASEDDQRPMTAASQQARTAAETRWARERLLS